MIYLLLQVFVFCFGTVIGSFLNVVIWRLQTKESFIFSRSYCPYCRHVLSILDLIPLMSFLFLKGKCRYCSLKINPSYFVIELTVGLLFLLCALQIFSPTEVSISVEALMRLLVWWYLMSILVIIFVYDLRHMLILQSVTLPATIIIFVVNLLLGMSWWSLFSGMIIGAGFFWLQYQLSQGKWIGGGDIYLGLLMGAVLGFPKILLALFIAYISGSAVGLLLMLMRKKSLQSELPFGTFLSVATVITVLFGDSIFTWYLSWL